jgi:type VI secretion system secreted protein VgrG
MVSQDSEDAATADAEQKNTATGEDKLPHSTDALLTIAAQAGWMLSAGQDIQVTAGETITWGAGQDISWAIGGSQRIHSGQAIGVLAGAVAAGDKAAGKGITLIAGKGDIEVQAQADQLQVAAKQDVSIQSKTAHIDWAAAKRIVLSTAGGASLTIEGGNIAFECPGTITTKAGKISFVGAEGVSYAFPTLPRSAMEPRKMRFKLQLADAPGLGGHPLAHTPWKIATGEPPKGLGLIDPSHLVIEGKSDAKGQLTLSESDHDALAQAFCRHPDRTWLVYPGHTVALEVTTEDENWTKNEKLFQALNAAEFSGDLQRTLWDAGALPQVRYAKAAFDTTDGDIYKKFKK